MDVLYSDAFPAVDANTMSSLKGNSNSSISSSSIQSTLNTNENNSLIQTLNSADSASSSVGIYGNYINSNTINSDTAERLTKINQDIVNKGDKDTYARQSEINEWQAQNKYDTLFFLQLTFLYFTSLVILFYLRQIGILPSFALYSLIGIGLLVVIFVLWNRASYTKISRDKRYWNRRYIGLEDGNLAAKLQCSLE